MTDKDTIIKLINIGSKMSKKYDGDYTRFAYSDEYDNFPFWQIEFINIGFEYPDFVPTVETFYRIGCPRITESGNYAPSYNFAENKPEAGVSVVTEKWLKSFKAIFWGTSDDDIRTKGVYQIDGIRIPKVGGDEEPLIIPVAEAKKTRIRTRKGLLIAVKKEVK